MRDDFSEPVKRAVAARAGHACSNPQCSAATSGPRVDEAKALNVGVAAHIRAASNGGPRYDDSQSGEDRRSANNAIWLCQTCAKLIANDDIRYPVGTVLDWKRQAESVALARIGKATASVRRSVDNERQIRRNLKVRDQLTKLMLRAPEDRRGRCTRPYEKFRTHKIVVRSLGDTQYPKVDAAPAGRISSWFTVEPYNFYHGGLEVILGIRLAAIDDDGYWAFSDDGIGVDEGRLRVAKVWDLGRIPWRSVREIDERGDEYYRGPHLYCDFNISGMPYEEFIAVELGDDYDWPLDASKKRLTRVRSDKALPTPTTAMPARARGQWLRRRER